MHSIKQEKGPRSRRVITAVIGMVAGALIGLTAATLAAPAAAEDEKAGEAPAQMSEPMVRHLLGAFGYSNITGLELKDGVWRATAVKDGKEHEVQVHAYSGAVTETK